MKLMKVVVEPGEVKKFSRLHKKNTLKSRPALILENVTKLLRTDHRRIKRSSFPPTITTTSRIHKKRRDSGSQTLRLD